MADYLFESYKSGIDTQKWLSLLGDREIFTPESLCIMHRFIDIGGEATCTQLSKKYGKATGFYNITCTKLAARIIDRTSCPIPSSNENEKRWPILFTGRYVNKKNEETEGEFIWKLRPELKSALEQIDLSEYPLYEADESKLKELISIYKSCLKQNRQKAFDAELYKWQTITECSDKSPIDIALYFCKTTNLVYAQAYASVVKYLVQEKRVDFENLLNHLFDESINLEQRISDYETGIKQLCENKMEFKTLPKDERTVATLLTCKNPYKYSFYMDSFYQEFCSFLGAGTEKTGRKYIQYLDYLHQLSILVKNDHKLVSFFAENAKDFKQSSLLIAQNIIFTLFYVGLIGEENMNDIRYFRMQMNDANGNRIAEQMLAKNLITASLDYAGDSFAELKFGDVILVHKGSYSLALVKVLNKNEESDPDGFGVDYTVKILKFYNNDGFNNVPRTGTFFQLKDKTTEVYKFVDKEYKSLMECPFNKEISLLKLKKNIILQGAPGTGKSYSTASIALGLIGEEMDYSDHNAVMQKYQEYVDGGRIAFVTFHQSMDYEDFVEGIKPKTEGDKITYEVEDGIFKQICNRANAKEGADISKCIDDFLQTIKGFENKKLIPTVTGRSSLYVWWNEGNTTISTRSSLSESTKAPEHSPAPLNIEKIKLQAIGEGEENNWRQYAQAFINAVKEEYAEELENKDFSKPYILIIDEINRGNVSKIFGELITLLEADKRAGGTHPIQTVLPYSKEKFSVPQNLFIIGTMNTTDRSVGNIDYAVRRRFAFVTLTADKSAIEKHYQQNEELKEKASKLFDKIESFLNEHKSDISIDDLMPGHSYFMADTAEDLRLKLEYELIPLVGEYAKDGIITAEDDTLSEEFKQWKQILQ